MKPLEELGAAAIVTAPNIGRHPPTLLHWRDALPEGRSAGMCTLHFVDGGFDGPLG